MVEAITTLITQDLIMPIMLTVQDLHTMEDTQDQRIIQLAQETRITILDPMERMLIRIPIAITRDLIHKELDLHQATVTIHVPTRIIPTIEVLTTVVDQVLRIMTTTVDLILQVITTEETRLTITADLIRLVTTVDLILHQVIIAVQAHQVTTVAQAHLEVQEAAIAEEEAVEVAVHAVDNFIIFENTWYI